MSDWKPGTVAVATVQGAPNVRVLRIGEGTEYGWVSGHQFNRVFYHLDREVTDVRPLVVLDLGPDVAFTVKALRDTAPCNPKDHDSQDAAIAALADQIEAQTKPPRIPEPGLWGVVDAETDEIGRIRWIHSEDQDWLSMAGHQRKWDDLIDPVLVREGFE